MEHRELPRVGTGGRRPETVVPDPVVSKPVFRLESYKPFRALGYRRIILRLTATLGLFVLGLLALWTGRSWLSRQSPYQIPFECIEVVPTPPAWFQGGIKGFLESVRSRAKESESVSILDVKRNDVKLSFERSPWVEGVARVSYPPRGIRVELQYREPVAGVRVHKDNEYLLDETGRILPLDDVDLDRLTRRGLIKICGDHLIGPLDPRPGETWKPRPAANEISEGNTHIPATARLAGFLARKMRSEVASGEAVLEFIEINPMDPENRGLFVFNRENSCFLWGEAPGEESQGSLIAEEKWTALRRWSERTKERSLPAGDYWAFSRNGLVHVHTQRASKARSSHPSSHPESRSNP